MGPEQSTGHHLTPSDNPMTQGPTPEEPIINDIFHQVVRGEMALKMSRTSTSWTPEAQVKLIDYVAGQLAHVVKEAHGHLNSVSTLVDLKSEGTDGPKPVMVLHVRLGDRELAIIEPPVDLNGGLKATKSSVIILTRNIFTASLLSLQRGINSDKEFEKRKSRKAGKKD